MRICLYVPCGHLLRKGWSLGYRLWCLIVNLSLSHWYPGSGVVLDNIDSWSLHPYFLWCCTDNGAQWWRDFPRGQSYLLPSGSAHSEKWYTHIKTQACLFSTEVSCGKKPDRRLIHQPECSEVFCFKRPVVWILSIICSCLKMSYTSYHIWIDIFITAKMNRKNLYLL